MICHHCRSEVVEGARFCHQCGYPLVQGCPSCGAKMRVGAEDLASRVCSSCMEPLEVCPVEGCGRALFWGSRICACRDQEVIPPRELGWISASGTMSRQNTTLLESGWELDIPGEEIAGEFRGWGYINHKAYLRTRTSRRVWHAGPVPPTTTFSTPIPSGTAQILGAPAGCFELTADGMSHVNWNHGETLDSEPGQFVTQALTTSGWAGVRSDGVLVVVGLGSTREVREHRLPGPIFDVIDLPGYGFFVSGETGWIGVAEGMQEMRIYETGLEGRVLHAFSSANRAGAQRIYLVMQGSGTIQVHEFDMDGQHKFQSMVRSTIHALAGCAMHNTWFTVLSPGNEVAAVDLSSGTWAEPYPLAREVSITEMVGIDAGRPILYLAETRGRMARVRMLDWTNRLLSEVTEAREADRLKIMPTPRGIISAWLQPRSLYIESACQNIKAPGDP